MEFSDNAIIFWSIIICIYCAMDNLFYKDEREEKKYQQYKKCAERYDKERR